MTKGVTITGALYLTYLNENNERIERKKAGLTHDYERLAKIYRKIKSEVQAKKELLPINKNPKKWKRSVLSKNEKCDLKIFIDQYNQAVNKCSEDLAKTKTAFLEAKKNGGPINENVFSLNASLQENRNKTFLNLITKLEEHLESDNVQNTKPKNEWTRYSVLASLSALTGLGCIGYAIFGK